MPEVGGLEGFILAVADLNPRYLPMATTSCEAHRDDHDNCGAFHSFNFDKYARRQGRLKVISSRARCHASQCEHSPDVVAQFLLARVN